MLLKRPVRLLAIIFIIMLTMLYGIAALVS